MFEYTKFEQMPEPLRTNVQTELRGFFDKYDGTTTTYRDIAKAINIIFSSQLVKLDGEYVRDVFRRWRGRNRNPDGITQVVASRFPTTPQEEVDPLVLERRKNERLMEENAQLRKAIRIAHKDEDSAEKIRESIYKISAYSGNSDTWRFDPTPPGLPGVPLALASDWHWGEVVNPIEVGGLNEFNTEIAISRAQQMVQKIIDLSFQYMVNPQYPGIVFGLGGDMISGDIHEELQDTNDRYTFQTIQDLFDHLCPAISLLADHFGNVFVPAVVGNHGRDTRKPRTKGRVYTSFEWHLYCMLERFFENDKRIHFMVPGETDAYFRVYDHRFLLTHGDSLGVKGGDGIIGSIGPIMRGAMKVGRSYAQIGKDFDTIMMGHWHQYISLRGLEVNGSLKGYDEFARLFLRAPYEPPTQNLFFLHSDYGVTAKWPIYLAPKRHRTELPWLSILEPTS